MGHIKLLFFLAALSLGLTLSRTEYLDACESRDLDEATLSRVIKNAIVGPEGDPGVYFIPSSIYINCYGNAREPGKYSSLSVTLDFDLDGEIKYTQEDFKCINSQWKPAGIASRYYDPDDTPTNTRNGSYSKRGCAECDSTDSSNEFGCVECSEECNQTVQGYPPCFKAGTDGCCHHLVNDKCVSRCPSNYVVSSLDTSLCVCADYWTGDACLNCSLSCLNGATLMEGCAGCACTLGYTGERCENEIDYCAPQPCLNNATCSYDLSGYVCTCTQGYTDPNCSSEIDYCYPYQCQNMGTCKNSRSGFSCECPEAASGRLCEYNDSCYFNPCQNNGECTNTNASEPKYLCKCAPGYLGSNCEVIDYCYNAVCQNSATCINLVNGYKCNCSHEHYGPQCQHAVTLCRPNPCLNSGICRNGSDEFTCGCQKAYTGKICDVEIDFCAEVICLNNGTCSKNLSTGFRCNCVRGFRGQYCEEEINYCENDPCQNGGSCSYDRFGYNCTCPAGFHGVDCSQLIQFCSPNPCENNATCLNSPSGYNCSCAVGYRGDICQEEIDYCDPPPCDKGVCEGSAGGYTCECDIGYSGVNCSTLIDTCSEEVCLNGGKCIQLEGNFTCKCQDPYTGRQCQDIDPDKVCQNVSCQNGGRCNHTSLRGADQSDLRKVLEGRSDATATPCECEGRWEGSYCDHCPICENTNVDCQECECKGLWSGPDCSDCSGHTTSEGECSETADTPSDTTNIIPIVVPLLLAGLGGLGSIPCIACISCKCKKMCERRRKQRINVHVIHKDMEKNGAKKSNKKEKTKVRDALSDRLQRLTGTLEESPTHSIVSTLSASEKSKHSTEIPQYLASGVYDRLPPAAEGNRGSAPGTVRFISQSSGGFKSILRSPLTSVPDESELRLICPAENSQGPEVQGYSNHSESTLTENKS